MKKFKTRSNIPEITIHCSSAEVESVSLLCPHHHLPAPGVVHGATPAVVGVVCCLVHLLVVEVEPGDVVVPGVNSGLHTEGDPPQSRPRDGEHTCNGTRSAGEHGDNRIMFNI